MSVWMHVTVTFVVDDHANIDPEYIHEVITKTSPRGSEGGLLGSYQKLKYLASSCNDGLAIKTGWGSRRDYLVESAPQVLFAYYGDLRDFGREYEILLDDWFGGIVAWLQKSFLVRMATLTYSDAYHEPVHRVVGTRIV